MFKNDTIFHKGKQVKNFLKSVISNILRKKRNLLWRILKN